MSSVRLTLLAACILAAPVSSAPDGAVFLYLQPLSRDAAQLTFAIASVSAVSATGDEYPLTQGLTVASPAVASRQRLLASGRLPVGRYAGFLIGVSRASVKDNRGDVALAVPDAPVRLNILFTISRQETPLFRLVLDAQGSVGSGTAFSPVFSVASPAMPLVGHTGFVTNSRSNSITVFDKHLAEAVAVIETCGGPAGMALDQARGRAYVACADDDEIQALDVAGGVIIDEVRLSIGDQPQEVALTPGGATLVSVNTGSNSISFFDAVSLTRQDRINVGSGPLSLLIDAAGRRAFVFNTQSSSISVIDLASRSLAATVALDSAPLRGQFDATGSRLYVIHERSPYLTVIDPRQLAVVSRVRLGAAVDAIAIDHVRDLVCLGGVRETAVEFYDPNALLPLYSMRAPAGVSRLLIDPGENTLYMVNPRTRTLMVGQLADRRMGTEIDVGEGAYWVAVMGEK